MSEFDKIKQIRRFVKGILNLNKEKRTLAAK